MKASIIIPAYNEEKAIGEVMRRVLALPMEKEIIAVENGSTDRTGKELAKFARRKEVTILRVKKNIGKGDAVRRALARAAGGVVVIQDADLEYPPEEIPKLVKPIADGAADAVYGSRFLGSAGGMDLTHRFGNWFLSMAARLLYGSRLTDIETGHKAFRTGLIRAEELKSDTFEIENEIMAKLLKARCRIAEIPIAYHARSKGKKITVMDGVRLFLWLVRNRLAP